MAVTVIVKRPLWHRGEQVEVGAQLTVEPLDAAELVASGRAVLQVAGDAEAVRDSVQKQTAALLRKAGHLRTAR